MVHRSPNIPEAWLRAIRSFWQNIASVAVLAAGPAIVSAASGGSADVGRLGMVGGQAALAAVLAYGYNRLWPSAGGKIPEAPARAGRSWIQNMAAGALVAGGGAIAGAGTADLKSLVVMACQAVLASVIAFTYNVVRPLPKQGADESEAEVSVPARDGNGPYTL